MSDMREDRSDKFKEQLAERGNPHGGHGRRAERNIAEQFETQTGHPLGERQAAGDGDETPADMRPSEDASGIQHTRKGQAESPRELNLNQPEKKREGHR